jgi:hypothetical protein
VRFYNNNKKREKKERSNYVRRRDIREIDQQLKGDSLEAVSGTRILPTATSIAPPSGIVKPRLQTSVTEFVSVSRALTSTHVSRVRSPGTDADEEPLLPPRLSN